MDETRLKRLRFRAWRRGFLEADLIFGPFADAYCPDLSECDLDAFEALLDQPDHDAYAWIVGGAAAPESLEPSLIERIRAFHYRGGPARP